MERKPVDGLDTGPPKEMPLHTAQPGQWQPVPPSADECRAPRRHDSGASSRGLLLLLQARWRPLLLCAMLPMRPVGSHQLLQLPSRRTPHQLTKP
jgi:hypothetical protein